MSKKDLKYYLGLDYDVKVIRIEDEGEFEYKAFAKELDDIAFYGVGDTKAEAIESFEDVRAELFEYYYENDIPIPEPVREKEEILPSGKFIIRTSPKTHAELIKLAGNNNQSLNSFINSIFEQFCTAQNFLSIATDKLKQVMDYYINKRNQQYDNKNILYLGNDEPKIKPTKKTGYRVAV